MRSIAGYLFLSHGPRRAGDVTTLPGAATQMRALTQQAQANNATLRVLGHDYARKIRTAEDLRTLFRLLGTCRDQARIGGDHVRIVMDDYSRLFRAASQEYRPELWSQLIAYSDHLRDLRQRRPLHGLSPEMAILIQFGALPAMRGSVDADKRDAKQTSEQTRVARGVSASVRRASARSAAVALQRAFDAYRMRYPKTTMRAFLKTEQAALLGNSQGRPWTYRTALRALRAHAERHDPLPRTRT